MTPVHWGLRRRFSGLCLIFLYPILEAYGDPLRHPGLLHGNAVKDICHRHRPLRVGNDDEVGLIEKFTEHGGKSADIGFVQRSVNLIEDAEWTWLAAKYGQ